MVGLELVDSLCETEYCVF